jgi:hypothetical protein
MALKGIIRKLKLNKETIARLNQNKTNQKCGSDDQSTPKRYYCITG